MRAMHCRLLALAAVLAAMAACSDSTGPRPADDPVTLRGIVADADGAPVAGASILLQYEQELVPGSVAAKPQLAVRFTSAEPDTGDLWLSAWCTDDTVRVAGLELPLMAGQYQLVWDGQDSAGLPVPDGVYCWNVVTRRLDLHMSFMLDRGGYSWLANDQQVAAQAVTDTAGAFVLDTTCLPFGVEFPAVDEFGQVIGTNAVSRRVRPWAVIPGHGAIAGPWVTIDAEAGADVVIAPLP